jgi:hypothetical protein
VGVFGGGGGELQHVERHDVYCKGGMGETCGTNEAAAHIRDYWKN